jgi:tetratricopeptide (TPR) repeat protein
LDESHRYYKEAFNLLTNKAEKSKENEELLIELLINWALVYYYRGDFSGLTDLLRNHEELASSLNNKIQIGMYYAWYGFTLCCREKNRDSLHFLNKALQIGEEIESNRIIGYACTWLTWVYSELGLMKKAIHFGERAQEIYRTHEPDQYIYFKSLTGMAVAYSFLGEHKKVLEAGKATMDFGHKHSNTRSLTAGQGMIGCAYFMDGNFLAAIECLQKAINISADPVYSQSYKSVIGLCYLLDGQFQKAENALRAVADFSRKFGFEIYGTVAEMGLGINLIAKGQISEGFKKLEECQQASLKNDRKYIYAMLEGILGKLYSQIAIGEGDIKPFDMIKNIGFLIKNVPFARKKAETHFTKAIELAMEIGAKGLAGQSYLDWGILNKEKNRAIQAKECISEAIRIFENCESEVYLEQANKILASFD